MTLRAGPYDDRSQAGRELAVEIARLGLVDPLVLALPRGGVPVALPIARALKAPLDLLMVRKIGAPWNPELAVAAIADGASPQLVVDASSLAAAGVSRDYVEQQAREQLAEIERRRARYVGGRMPVACVGRSVVVVDDGIATGATMRAALQAVRQQGPARLVLAVPVAPPATVARMSELVDEVVCPYQPEPFMAVGCHYRRFDQVSDDEVVALLAESAGGTPAAAPAP